MSRYMTMKEVAEYLNISRTTAYCWVQAYLPHFKRGGVIGVRQKEHKGWHDAVNLPGREPGEIIECSIDDIAPTSHLCDPPDRPADSPGARTPGGPADAR